jgi:hypothetical protein
MIHSMRPLLRRVWLRVVGGRSWVACTISAGWKKKRYDSFGVLKDFPPFSWRKAVTDSTPQVIVAGDVSIDWMDAPVSYTGPGVIPLLNELALTPPDQVIHSFQIKKRAKELFAGDGVKIDPSVLRALLLSFAFVMNVTRCHPPHPALSPTGGEDTGEGAYTCNRSITYAILVRIPEYKHWRRSMETILDMSLLSEGETFHLPEKLKEAFRREADKKMAQHDTSNE